MSVSRLFLPALVAEQPGKEMGQGSIWNMNRKKTLSVPCRRLMQRTEKKWGSPFGQAGIGGRKAFLEQARTSVREVIAVICCSMICRKVSLDPDRDRRHGQGDTA